MKSIPALQTHAYPWGMKQTHEHSPWYAGLMQQVRRRTETLLDAYDTLPAITKAAEVERAARALLAISRLAEFADRLMRIAEPEGGMVEAEPAETPEVSRPMNRHERRQIEAKAKAALKAGRRALDGPSEHNPPTAVTIPTNPL